VESAERYCIERYNRYDIRSNFIFSELYRLYLEHLSPSLESKLQFLEKYGFRLGIEAIKSLEEPLKVQNLQSIMVSNSISNIALLQRGEIISQLLTVYKTKVILARLMNSFCRSGPSYLNELPNMFV
jgi:hypothetical protein